MCPWYECNAGLPLYNSLYWGIRNVFVKTLRVLNSFLRNVSHSPKPQSPISPVYLPFIPRPTCSAISMQARATATPANLSRSLRLSALTVMNVGCEATQRRGDSGNGDSRLGEMDTFPWRGYIVRSESGLRKIYKFPWRGCNVRG